MNISRCCVISWKEELRLVIISVFTVHLCPTIMYCALLAYYKKSFLNRFLGGVLILSLSEWPVGHKSFEARNKVTPVNNCG